MSVILTILKIIGILLLAVLGLLLTVLLLVLFVPIRYRAEGGYREDIAVTARVTWLCHLLSVRAAFAEKAFSYQVKVCGIRLLPKQEKAAGQAGEKAVETAAQAGAEAVEVGAEAAQVGAEVAQAGAEAVEAGTEAAQVGAEAVEAGAEAAQAMAEAGTKATQAVKETVTGAGETDTGETQAGESEKPGFSEKLRAFVEGLLEKLRAACARIKDIRAQIAWYKELLTREDTKRSIRLAWRQLVKILRHIRPRKLHAAFIIGTGDPASTGQVLAVHGMLYPLLGEHVSLVPDFEEKHIEGEFQLKGHITICMLLICALRVILNKEIRQLIQRLRKKEEA